MIDVIIGILTGIRNLLYYGFLLSYEIGKLLVRLIQISWVILRYLYDIFQTLATVICEDFVVFLRDVYEHIACVSHIVNSTIGGAYQFVHVTIIDVKYYISYGRDVISTSFYNVLYGNLKFFGIIGQLFVGIKHLFILLGSGMWFLLTLIPLSVLYWFSLCTYYVGVVIEEFACLVCVILKPIVKFIQDVIDFTFDVPFEATAGFIAGSCLIYLVIKFHMIAYTFLKEQVILSLWSLRSIFRNNLPQRVQRTVRTPSPGPSPNTTRNRDATCVICQEREKCILILPCKHMCLCSECKDELYRFHSRCPICRSYVHRTMKVFV
ncbi:hypothetical protein QE152_g13042 [Popillia japonica]|uniref:RING-type domain-containing protein n=1 Tax=Popillia japonica TaxID=7064 RepID=A0AAW1LFR7_POPJA